MSSLTQRITTDIKEAMKNKDQAALNVIRSLKSAIQLATIEKYGAGGELDEAESVAVIRKAIKQRQDSVASFEAGGRPELAETEKAEIAVLERYLPEALSEGEIQKLVEEVISELGATTRKEMGGVMKRLQERIAGRADNKIVSQMVGERLK
ncbi:MAG: hypothetical protein DVB23_000329 [Verrucomicrobia bacterium]|jgi:uncharacterized protein YqeY|nr:MAG: hypothetical protein DVB23_000329 [Verrucomicrobiota bacterium]